MKQADLHMHSTVSDGGYTPSELMLKCAEAEYEIVSLTDHDSTSGLLEAEKAAEDAGMTFLAGIELSTEVTGISVDILGYGINTTNTALQKTLEFHRKKRFKRMENMIRKCKEHNLQISLEDVEKFVTGDTYSRPHIARALVEKGYAADMNEAFYKYIGRNKKCFVPKEEEMTPAEAAKLIKNAGGVAVIAHPVYYQIDQRIKQWLIDGLIDGVEIYHRDHRKEDIERFEKITREAEAVTGRRYFRTGGTDFHHENFGREGEKIGKSPLPFLEAAYIQQFIIEKSGG